MIEPQTIADTSAVPWVESRPLSEDVFESVKRRSVFECYKWDQQVTDISVLSHFPIVLKKEQVSKLRLMAENLSAETLAVEMELLDNPALYSDLGFSAPVLKVLKRASKAERTPLSTRVIRFDFHWTTQGWRVSEANTDVPSGFVEASGITRLMAPSYEECSMAGDPAGALAESAYKNSKESPLAVFVHATAYSEDRQVMEYLASRFRERGFRTLLASPAHIRWKEGKAFLVEEWGKTPVDFIYRFFPAESLPQLPKNCGWQNYYYGSNTRICNTATTVLTQTKRLPLVWDRLKTPTTTWRKLLPETVCPSDPRAKISEEWVFKPALGRIGEDVAIAGEMSSESFEKIIKKVKRNPKLWVAQKRFEALPMRLGEKDYFPCVGVYTVDGRAAGLYGRLSTRKITDKYSQDAAVFVGRD